MEEKLIEFLTSNVSYDDLSYTYTLMCVEGIPFKLANNKLWGKISDLIDEFINDNELNDEWFEENFLDIDEIFEKMFDNYLCD